MYFKMTAELLVIILNFLLYAETAPSLSNIKLIIDDYDNPPQYNWPVNERASNSDRIRKQLIEKAIHLLNTQKETKPNNINDCLKRQDSLLNTLNCVKHLVKKHRRNQNHFPKNSKHYQYNIKKDFNEYDSDETDLTKANLNKSFNSRSNFSQDYLDVADLLRTDAVINVKDKKRYAPKTVKQKNKYGRFDYDLSRFRKSNSDYVVKKSLRSDSNSDYSASSGSQEDDRMKEPQRGYKERREDKYHTDSSEVSSEEIPIRKLKPKRGPKSKKAIPKRKKAHILYMQGPSRLYREDGRRRLPYFFPKRLHWNEDDVKNLRDYWINGPQGKYSGYRVTY